MSPVIPPEIVCAADYERAAEARLDRHSWDYLAGGAGEEWTLRENRAAFARLRLRARVLRDLGGANTRSAILGQALEHPILLAPVALQRLAHPEGELATALGAAATGTGMVVSTQASQPIEAIAARARVDGAAAPLWFQLYLQHDRDFTAALLGRAEAAGYGAVVLTVDAPVTLRDREARGGFRLPEGLVAVNLAGLPPAPANRATPAESPVFRGLLDAAPRWSDLAWLRAHTRLPILLKGITDPDDAAEAVALGADGIIVSNHGGRTLDGMPAAIDLLPAVAARVAGRVPVLLDGGVRRGTDVLKALALGASAVLVGRPQVHALAVGGAVGVAHLVKILRTELEAAMALCGCRDLAAVTRAVLWEDGAG
ncbi:alpha-hydroxy acid oxidase [Roseomonas elaeocarpi]|uniref:Alpha-hydroxy acid oxidase n=1 Tax=Roseomonas elaeocarpi TaxID=907779 RepID=A0ABV6JTK0_9PROT